MIDLMLGDCLEQMSWIADGSVDAIITDPPYGTTACKWDSVIPFEPMWEQLKRIIKPNGAIVLFGSEPFSSALRMSNIKQYKYDWKLDKNRVSNPMLAKIQPLRHMEDILVFNSKTYYPQGLVKAEKQGGGRKKHKSDIGIGNNGNYRQTMTNYPRQLINYKFDNYGKNCFHPTQKPVALLEYLIKTYTNEGETVLDFTMGSGTTGVACINTNRNFIGIEKDTRYFDIAQKRINDAKLTPPLTL